MRSTTFIAVFGLASSSYAHHTLGHLLVDGKDTGLWKHVLEVEGPPEAEGSPKSFIKTYPQNGSRDFTREQIICGREAFGAMNRTSVADVVAGEEIGFRTMSEEEIGMGPGYGYIYHPGAGQIWLSKPMKDLESYRGEGDWFKVAYAGPKSNTEWSLSRVTDFNFTLPKTTPPGQYLMRFEHIYPMSFADSAQFFINCALINVIGPGGGVPTHFSRFPASYNAEDPALRVPQNQEKESFVPDEELRLLEYKPFGGPVWTG